MQMREKMNTVIKDYDILLESLIFIFRNLEEVRQILNAIQCHLIYIYALKYVNYSSFVIFKIERKIEEAKQEVEHASNFTKLTDVDGSLNKLNILKTFITESLLQIHTKSEEIIDNIRLQEPLESATQDIEKLNRTIDSVRIKFELFQTETSNRLEEHRHLCIFREDIEKINYDLRELNEQLKNMDGRIGDNLSVLKATLTAFEQFEQTITVNYIITVIL